MQQEANKRLGMSVSQTMQCAQSLYESGFISYMRTDSTTLSEDAHSATEQVVSQDYGDELIALKRQGTKSKNAQEAHEAIRPAIQPNGAFLRPHQMKGSDKDASIKLYQLIYQRTVASRMVEQVLNQTSVSIEGASPDGKTNALFRASGSVVVAPGYTLASGRSSIDTILAPLEQGQELDCHSLTCISHSTQPPPRYNEASFVKELEARGVGRPSTYAGTVQILRDRAYVGTPVRADDTGRRSGKVRTGAAISAQRAAGGEGTFITRVFVVFSFSWRMYSRSFVFLEFTGGGRGPLVPSLSAFVVCSLLEKHCGTYVDPGFTASMEERLDEIARGEEGADRVAYLDEFYAGDNGLAAKVKRIDETVSADEARRADLPALFLSNANDGEEIALFVGPWGPYVQRVSANGTETSEKPPSASLPAGMATDLSTITPQTLNALLSSRESNGELMGMHPDDNRPIRLKIGRFGAYLQWGEDEEENTTTHSLPKHLGSMRNLDVEDLRTESDIKLSDMIDLSLEEAIGYISLPRTVSTFNDLPIVAAIGPYGPYLKYNNSFVSLNKKDGDVLTVDAEAAERVVTEGIVNKSSSK
jgi:DNA topoisomerase-1